MLNEVATRARMMLKALKGQGGELEEKKAPVPAPPEDPDRLDPRMEGASPTDADLDEAKEKGEASGADGDGEGEGGTSGGDEDGNGAGAGAGDGTGTNDGAGDGDEAGFDEFGHKDMDPREIRKAFPEIGHLFPDEALDYIEGHGDESGKEAKGLEVLLKVFRGMTETLDRIQAELNRLAKGSEVQNRELKKALESKASLEEQIKNLHQTVPAANQPRAIVKALEGAGGQQAQGFTSSELNTLAVSKQMSSQEISLLCLTSQRG